ncbi:class I histocompatibility antigen, F10 alpha chain-like [Mauremys mutica]|uniref:class I histocompatibility antigen, F10 alpha chain-like n=1 Tax=Mauremys mutica TaxID=74926 RepID=UPI001D165192|nr:class I histocompatibility antigen, F10 alpha chain-like [Mauremys mutica]
MAHNRRFAFPLITLAHWLICATTAKPSQVKHKEAEMDSRRHSLSVLVTAVINEDGTHHFTMIARLDDVQILYYSSDRREVRATQPWAEQALGAEYLQEKTQEFWVHEEDSEVITRRWMQLHNQTDVPWCHRPAKPPLTPPFPDFNARSELSPSSTGVHTEQVHVGCALSGQTPVDPRFQYAYDGGDFMRFDAQTGTWVAAVQPAVPVKQRWETLAKTWTRYVQWLLQSECLETLRRLVQQGRAVLERQVPPEVSVSCRDTPDSSIILSCRARGFYPRPIHVSWVRDGEDILAEMDSSGILPNADGTYYTQSSLEISPQQDGHRYACRVEHSSLGEPTLVWAPGKKGPLPPGVLAAIVLAVLVLAGAVGAGVVLWRRKSAGERRSPRSRDVGSSGAWGSPASPRGNGS